MVMDEVLGVRSMAETAVERLTTDRSLSSFSTNWSLMIVMVTILDWKSSLGPNDGLNVIGKEAIDSKSLSLPIAEKTKQKQK